jgi:hypothetical protein
MQSTIGIALGRSVQVVMLKGRAGPESRGVMLFGNNRGNLVSQTP